MAVLTTISSDSTQIRDALRNYATPGPRVWSFPPARPRNDSASCRGSRMRLLSSRSALEYEG